MAAKGTKKDKVDFVWGHIGQGDDSREIYQKHHADNEVHDPRILYLETIGDQFDSFEEQVDVEGFGDFDQEK